jgi:hypothetical protein
VLPIIYMVMADESIKAALYARDYKLAVKHFFSVG